MNQNRISVCVIGLCLITIVFLWVAARKTFFDQDENGCEMTYMFEYPEYIRVKLKKKISKNYPRYGLYLYGEGSYAQEQRKVFEPIGIPVLFIPGNAGSYRQVRSLASVALRKAEHRANHFNYFTIDFDEDFSGLYGGVLMDQVNFVHSCLRHIIRRYKEQKSGPESVILIGHSMGGMIARALFTLENFQSKFVSIIITLGTPHLAPVIPFDRHFNTFYLKVNELWKNNPVVANLSLISLAGGARDILVPAKYCSLPHNMHIDLQYSAVATAVPDTWITIDHLALCWCKQLILVINRALFALIDEANSRITTDKVKKVQILRKYFGISDDQNEETLPNARLNQSPTIYNETSLWNHFEEISLSGSTLLIPVHTSRNDAQFIALSKSLGDVSIMSCQNVKVERCIASKRIVLQAYPKTPRKKAVFLHFPELTNTSYIMMSSKDRSKLAVQFLPRFHTNKHFDRFRVFSGVQRFSSPNNLFLNVSLPMIRNCFDVYLITVEKVGCENNGDGLFAGRIHIPWSHEDVYARPEESTEFSILLKLHTSKPAPVSAFAQLHIWKTDECSLEVTVEYQFFQTLGRILIVYAPLIPQWIYSWIMVVLVIGLRHMSNKGIYLSVWSAITSGMLPLFIPLFILVSNELLIKSLMEKLGWSDMICPLYVVNGLALYDWLLPSCFVILTAFAIFLALYTFLEIILLFFTWLLLFCSSKNIQPPTQTSTSVKALFYSCFGLVLFCLMSLCSSLAIYFLTIICFFHCCKTTMKSRLSNTAVGSLDRLDVASKLNLSKLLLILLLVISFQTTPAFIVWLKVLPTSWFLPADPFHALDIILIPTVVCCLEMHVHKPPKYAWCTILFIWYVGFLLYSLDRLPYIAGCILLAVDLFMAFDKYSKHKKS